MQTPIPDPTSFMYLCSQPIPFPEYWKETHLATDFSEAPPKAWVP